MDISKILPDIGATVSTTIIDDEQLDEASLGDIIHAATLLAKIAAEKIADPATYHQLATFTGAAGADWNGLTGEPSIEQNSDHREDSEAQHTSPPPPEPTPPDNYYDSLPGLGHMFKLLNRASDVMMANFARYVDASIDDQIAYFGAPYKKSLFRDSKEYMRNTMKLSRHTADKHYLRSTSLTYAPGDDPELLKSQPKLSLLAQSFIDGNLPGENADRILGIDEDLAKYATKVGQTTEFKDAALQAFEPTLVEAGESDTPDEMSRSRIRWTNRIAHEIDPDGPSPSEALRKQADNAIRTRENSDGSARLWMDATPDVYAAFKNFAYHQLNFNGKIATMDPELVDLFGVDAVPRVEDAKATIDPDEVVAEDLDGNPVTAGYMALIDAMSPGQKLGAILTGMFNTLLRMDPAEIGIKKSHGASAQLIIVQDIETAYKTIGLPALPPDAQRPSGAQGKLPPMLKRPNPNGPNAPDALKGHNRASCHCNAPPWTDFQSEVVNIGSMHPKDAEILACNSELVGQIWHGPDTVLNQKRAVRLFTPTQRRAIMARDKGCQAPACPRPIAHCDIHHIKEWLSNGRTDVENGIALCGTHHAALHNGKWTIQRVNGLTFFQPAKWLDPEQPLLRNTYWNI